MYGLLLNICGGFLLVILAHELGHLLTIYNYTGNRNIEIRIAPLKPFIAVGYKQDYSTLDDNQYSIVLWNGILAGFIVLTGLIAYYDGRLLIPLWAQYLFFCRSDLKQIIGVMR